MNQETADRSEESVAASGRRGRLWLAAVPAVVLLGVIVWFAPPTRAWLVRRDVRKSAIDVAILAKAVASMTLDYGPMAPYPDEAYVSVESRARYGLPTNVPQRLVDQMGEMDRDDLPISDFLENTPWKHEVPPFELWLRKWIGLAWPYPRMRIAEIEVRQSTSDVEAAKRLWRETEKRGIKHRDYMRQIGRGTKIPKDPFAEPGTDRLYRYGRPFKPTPTEEIQCYFAWVVVGNGPDRDADLDVSRFNPRWRGWHAGRARGIDWGFDGNPVDLVYDPTNGLSSSGDIFLMSEDLLRMANRRDEAKVLWSAEHLLTRLGARTTTASLRH